MTKWASTNKFILYSRCAAMIVRHRNMQLTRYTRGRPWFADQIRVLQN